MTTSYIQGAINRLADQGLLTVKIEKALNQYADEKRKARDVERPREVINFGKYKNKLWADILKIDAPYVDWCMRQSWVLPETRAFVEDLYRTIHV